MYGLDHFMVQHNQSSQAKSINSTNFILISVFPVESVFLCHPFHHHHHHHRHHHQHHHRHPGGAFGTVNKLGALSHQQASWTKSRPCFNDVTKTNSGSTELITQQPSTPLLNSIDCPNNHTHRTHILTNVIIYYMLLSRVYICF